MRARLIFANTYGCHAFMKMELDGIEEEIDVYWREDGEHYRTSADNNPDRREQIITAFKELY